MKSLHGVDHPKSGSTSSERGRSRDLVSKKAGHVIVHFDPQVKLHLDCNFVSVIKGVYIVQV